MKAKLANGLLCGGCGRWMVAEQRWLEGGHGGRGGWETTAMVCKTEGCAARGKRYEVPVVELAELAEEGGEG
jgi:hypothetical protein